MLIALSPEVFLHPSVLVLSVPAKYQRVCCSLVGHREHNDINEIISRICTSHDIWLGCPVPVIKYNLVLFNFCTINPSSIFCRIVEGCVDGDCGWLLTSSP